MKPITYLKNRTAELLREVSEGGHAVTITQNGERYACGHHISRVAESQIR